ncbi:Uncharacterized protein TCM_031135 [Theobroma cacao]|uniref:Uncharacterized protein n=1 Tax=Theobroma cacao TaxID=3641 RepID=A0A061F6J3_THECC|nr:Uncharacterized protein TCM_031135 [Theobroma cacao]
MRERWESLQGMFEGTNVHGIGGGYGYQLKESMGNSKENREGRSDEGEKISSESEDDEKKNNELGRKLGEEWELNRMRRSKGVKEEVTLRIVTLEDVGGGNSSHQTIMTGDEKRPVLFLSTGSNVVSKDF